MRWGFFGLRGLNEFVNENGDGVVFSIKGVRVRGFFPNVGQPDPNPPFNPLHKDNPDYDSNVKLICANFHPFHAKYEIRGNLFEWIENGGRILLRAELKDEAIFSRAGEGSIHTSGIEFDKPAKGLICGALSHEPFVITSWDKEYAEAAGSLPPCADVRVAAQASVLYNLMTSGALPGRFYVPVNRTWIGFLGGIFGIPEAEAAPQVFGWDTSFASIILSGFDRELAKVNLDAVLDGIRPDGRIPQIRIGRHVSDRTNPPVWFIAAEILARTGGADYIDGVFDRLAANYEWFKRNRGNTDGTYGGTCGGTYSWGTGGEEPGSPIQIEGYFGAVMESGLDDSPLFDGMQLDGGKLDHACVDLSCLVYRAAEILKDFAQRTGRDGGEYAADLEVYRDSILQFFDYDNGIVNSFKVSGGVKTFSKELTPASFYPLLMGLVGEREVKLLEGLFESGHFRGMLPSLSFESKQFTGDGDYWRGRVWPPMVWLAAKGFERHGSPVYGRIKVWAEEFFIREWKTHGHVHENYSATTGQGEPQNGVYARSCPLYSWGGLLGIL